MGVTGSCSLTVPYVFVCDGCSQWFLRDFCLREKRRLRVVLSPEEGLCYFAVSLLVYRRTATASEGRVCPVYVLVRTC